MHPKTAVQECRLLETLAAGVVVVDVDGHISFVNPIGATIFRREPEELVGHELAEFVFPEDVPKVERDLKERQEGRSASWIGRIQQKDGTPRWLRVTGTPLRTPTGAYDGAIGVFFDVTDAQVLSETARANGERLNLTLSSLPVILVEQDLDLRYVWLRGSQLPLPAEQILGRTDDELFPPEIAHRLREIKSNIIKTGRSEQLTLPFTAGNQLRFYDASFAPYLDAQEKISGIAGALLDITSTLHARHLAEENDARFRLVLSLSTLTAFTQDKDLCYTWIYNPPAHKDEADFLGKTDADIFPSDQAALLTEIKRSVLETGVGRKAEIKLGHTRTPGTYELTVEPQRDLSGDIVGILGLAIDITERVRAEKQMEETIRSLEVVVEHSSEAICLIDNSGTIRCASGPAGIMLGYTREELQGMDCTALLDPADMFRARFELTDLQRDPSGSTVSSLRLCKKSGVSAWFQLKVLIVAVGGSHAYLITLDRNLLSE